VKPLVVAIGISHKDAALAELWLKWVSFLCMQPGGDNHKTTLLVVGTQRVTDDQWLSLRSAMIPSDGMFKVVGSILSEEQEAGYPISASHLFLRTMEYCETEFPGHPVLWVEADAIPTRPSWVTEIQEEYTAAGKPFLGAIEKAAPPHMPGVAVYPPNWRELAPKLANVLLAPDTPQWGNGRGQAFDVYAADQILPHAAVAKTIQQIWRPQPFDSRKLILVQPDTALFHQSKDGTLIATLARAKYPDFQERIETPTEQIYAARGHHHKKVILKGDSYQVVHRTMRVIGGWWSVVQPRNVMEYDKLERMADEGIVERVTRQALDHEAAKVMKTRRIIHV